MSWSVLDCLYFQSSGPLPQGVPVGYSSSPPPSQRNTTSEHRTESELLARFGGLTPGLAASFPHRGRRAPPLARRNTPCPSSISAQTLPNPLKPLKLRPISEINLRELVRSSARTCCRNPRVRPLGHLALDGARQKGQKGQITRRPTPETAERARQDPVRSRLPRTILLLIPMTSRSCSQ